MTCPPITPIADTPLPPQRNPSKNQFDTGQSDTTPPPQDHIIRVPGYEGADRREGYSQWRRAVHERLNDGAAKMDQLRVDLDKNTASTNAVKSDTSEMLEIFRALKGALSVLNWIGKLAKPIGAIAMAGAAVAGLWTALKSGVPPGGIK